MLARQLQQPVREIVYRTREDTHGPIARLVSPSDLGELIKPFVFLDRFDFDARAAPMEMELGWHPHSGIATVTVVLEGSIRYSETTGKAGVLSAGSVEWMRAGNGVWHTGAPEPGHVKGFQLWVALPPELENVANASHYVMPEEVPVEGPVRVILGAYGKAKSPIASASHELPRGELEGRRALVLSSSEGTHAGLGRRAGWGAPEFLAHSQRGDRDLRTLRGIDRLRRRGRHEVRARLSGQAFA